MSRVENASDSVSPEVVATAGEREVLESFLDFHRSVVVSRIEGLSAHDATRRRVPSLTTIAGIVKHLTVVERNWFEGLLGIDARHVGANEPEDGDGSWTVDLNVGLDELVDDYVQRAPAPGSTPATSRPAMSSRIQCWGA